MFRSAVRLSVVPSSPTGQQQQLSINSPYSLLRMIYRSVDICVKSRHAKRFLKKRTIESWRAHRGEVDPDRQRFVLERAGSFLQMLHTPKTPQPGVPIVFQLSRAEAERQKDLQREALAKSAKDRKTR